MATSSKRIYVVTEQTDAAKTEFMVRAQSKKQAVAHLANGRFGAEVASTDDALRLAAAGVAVQDAGVEE